MKANLTYSRAYEKLEKLAADMESGELAVDQLVEKVKEAKELIAFCEKKLRTIEKEFHENAGETESGDQRG